ncbi:hypothetical protein [Streptomyces sp. MMBL 11-1]|uniref:hypothetical protein n=1 Tax=Streptomyces sp. MMBL 11-1 TaxID=3026420 RepID=UPI002362B083|nr:hypothetical protein [Streptomyces sp. MMBL 11-1]
MSDAEACCCVVRALVVMAPDPETEPGRYFVCRTHGQMIVWDGRRWRWSDQAEDIDQLPPTADAGSHRPV